MQTISKKEKQCNKKLLFYYRSYVYFFIFYTIALSIVKTAHARIAFDNIDAVLLAALYMLGFNNNPAFFTTIN